MRTFDETKRFHVRKINKRLAVHDRQTGGIAYDPPRFLVLRSRVGLEVLAEKFEAAGGPEGCIEAITRFEAKRSPRARIADGLRRTPEAEASPARDRSAQTGKPKPDGPDRAEGNEAGGAHETPHGSKHLRDVTPDASTQDTSGQP